MSITDYKVTDGDISAKGVTAAPTVLSGTPEENKRVFDRLIRDVVKQDLNGLIDALTASTGAGEIGASVEGLAGATVQAVLNAVKAGLDSKESTAAVTAGLALKSDKAVTDGHFKSVGFDAETGIFTFTKENGTTVTVDTALEKVAVNFAYDSAAQSLVLTLADGTTQRISLADFLTTTEFHDSDSVEWSVSPDGASVTAAIRPGSVTDSMLESTLKEQLKGYVAAAAGSAEAADGSEAAALSYRAAAQEAAAAAAGSRSQAAASQSSAAESAAAARTDADRAASASAHPPQISTDGYWMLWSAEKSTYEKTAFAAQGPKGEDGSSYTVKGLYATLADLQAAHPSGSVGDAWLIGTADSNVVYQWDTDRAAWVNVGALKGPKGDPGTDGVTPHIGSNGNWFIGSTDTGTAAQGPAGQDGAPGDTGPQGPQGEAGTPGSDGAAGKSAYQAARDGGYTGTESDFNTALAQVSTIGTKAFPCNPNLLDNWYFGNPVNQRGQTEYTDAGYTIDRWITTKAMPVTVAAGGITLSPASGSAIFRQAVDVGNSTLAGMQCTCSVLVTANTCASAVNVLYGVDTLFSIPAGQTGLFKGTKTLSAPIGSDNVKIMRSSATEESGALTLLAVKLELGDTQTLVHQDANGSWVLNEIPNYGEQLLRCQRYCTTINAWTRVRMSYYNSNNLYFMVPTPCGMRAAPSLSDPSGSLVVSGLVSGADQAGFNFSVSSLLSGAVLVVANKTAHGLTDGQLVKRGGSDYTAVLLSADL